jgi:NADH-quinone oxidoreductase subunit N
MNAIIASAFLGVLMMFASWIFDNEQTHTRIALAGLLALIVANVLQLNGIYTIPVDYKGMLSFTQFGLYVNTILFILTFLYVWLNGDEIAKIGNHAADFYALFFLYCRFLNQARKVNRTKSPIVIYTQFGNLANPSPCA